MNKNSEPQLSLIKDHAEVIVRRCKMANLSDKQIIDKLANEYNVAMELLYTILSKQAQGVIKPYEPPLEWDEVNNKIKRVHK